MFVGEWSSYYSLYKLQKLPNSTNDSKGDFIATLNLIRQIAKEECKELPRKKLNCLVYNYLKFRNPKNNNSVSKFCKDYFEPC